MTVHDLLTAQPPHTDRTELHAQVVKLDTRESAKGKPFWDVTFADGTAEIKLRVFDNNPAALWMPGLNFQSGYPTLKVQDFLSLTGHFTAGDYGWESKDFAVRFLGDAEIEQLLSGNPERRAFLEARYQHIVSLVASMKCRVLRQLSQRLLEEYAEPLRRAAAARGNHHARRGGLVEHIAEMMDSADRLCLTYPQLNRSLLLAGVLFHDIGKIFENQYELRGFAMPFTRRGELFGHIVLGVEIARRLATMQSSSHEETAVIESLCHLIIAHHGELEWGSPTEPKLIEAVALHYLDQISAKLEMFKAMLALPESAPGIHDKGYPIRVHAVDSPKELCDEPV